MSINRKEVYSGEKTCSYCGQNLTGKSISAIGNHIKWCKFKAHPSSIYKETANKRFGQVKEFIVQCYKCQKEIVVTERQKLFPSKSKYYCSRSCANSRQRTTQIKDKISQGVKSSSSFVPAKLHICPNCFQEYKGNAKFCSKQCRLSYFKSKRPLKQQYALDCKFRFNLWDYPEQFNLDMLHQNGMYKASNRGNNLQGVSRDHMYSVSQGFQNNIDPTIISHPANCQLLIHTENQSKGGKSKIALEQLLERINKFNKKYNK